MIFLAAMAFFCFVGAVIYMLSVRRQTTLRVYIFEKGKNTMETEKQIEFHKIKEIWSQLAVTQRAKERIAETTFILSEGELKKQLRDTTDSREMIEKLGTPPLQNVDEIKEIMMAAEKGDCLTPYQLERVERVLVAVRRLKDYLGRGKMYDNPIAFYEENLDEAGDVREEICRQIRNSAVDDYASKELAQLRGQIERCEEQMKQKAEQIMRADKAYMADQYCTFRNGRLCVPVKKEYKLKVSGSVIDKSATGSTLFIEPTGVARYYEELQQLKIGEENEVYRILYTLTAMVASVSPVMGENISMLERLDFIFSKGKLSIDLGATEPAVNTERRIVLKNARHPLMDRAVNVPLQFAVGEGDVQDIAENLSTFSAHIKNVLEVLSGIDRDSLVIMDELGSGTDPAEGMGIAIAILEELRKSGAIFLVTTHYPEVKEYAEKTKGMINARMTFDRETLSPTYQMVIGEAGESCAFYIADRLGMPHDMLRTAVAAAYGEEAVSTYHFQTEEHADSRERRGGTARIRKSRQGKGGPDLSMKYKRGDSVMVYPDKKIGIVCAPINEKGVLRVQLPDKKIWINHKRVKLHVAAAELYPEDYDFSIIFDSVANRKIRHDMDRKYTEDMIRYEE